MNKDEVIRQIRVLGILPAVHTDSANEALFAAAALHHAGLPVVEIPFTLTEAPAVIADLLTHHPEMIVGAGTVLDLAEARCAIEAGARFLTSTGFVPEVVECARQAGVAVFPGAMTPSEVIAAWKAGADFVKIFPAATMGGAPYIRALQRPLAKIPLIVSGGVNQLNLADYLRAGACAVGIGVALLPDEALRQRQEHRIHELATRLLALVSKARSM